MTRLFRWHIHRVNETQTVYLQLERYHMRVEDNNILREHTTMVINWEFLDPDWKFRLHNVQLDEETLYIRFNPRSLTWIPPTYINWRP